MVTRNTKTMWGLLILLIIILTGWSAASPYLTITGEQWQDALDANIITGLDANDWADILPMLQYPDEGEEFPNDISFTEPSLYVYAPPGKIQISNDYATRMDINYDSIVNFTDFAVFADNWLKPVQDYSFLIRKGLLMTWSDETLDPNIVKFLASGWQYKYGEDPDYTNVTVSVTVTPTANMNMVVLGFRDTSYRDRIWEWDVPSPIPANRGTRITINTALSGRNAANPVASRYSSHSNFDITNVLYIRSTETATGIIDSSNAPPPLGSPIDVWNYWDDFVVVPNVKAEPPTYYKWRQPAQFIADPTYYWGWDETSIEANEPLLADDFCCRDNRPITGIRWWGSFPNRDSNEPGWMFPYAPDEPGLAPTGFQIGIWSDTPGDPNGQDLTMYSHPNEMLFKQYCDAYDVNFVGYDRDPNDPNHPVIDACFKFSCELDPNFVQEPDSNRIYWLSIAAVYDSNIPQYVWGWKTRPHYYNDDAVRITSIEGGGWPPTIGSQYQSGEPLECPQYCSWDLAFELITDVNDPNSYNCF